MSKNGNFSLVKGLYVYKYILPNSGTETVLNGLVGSLGPLGPVIFATFSLYHARAYLDLLDK